MRADNVKTNPKIVSAPTKHILTQSLLVSQASISNSNHTSAPWAARKPIHVSALQPMEDKMRPNFFELSSSELVKAYNHMAAELASLSEGEAVPTDIKRFATRDAGLRRIETVYKALCEKKGEEYEAPPDNQMPVPAPPRKQKAKKVAKPQKATKAKKATKSQKANVRSVKSEIVELCKVSGGTNRARALDYLAARLGKQCATPSIMTAVYGEGAETTTNNAFFTVMKGLVIDITKSRCKFEIKRVKDGKGNTSYGLYSKNGNG